MMNALKKVLDGPWAYIEVLVIAVTIFMALILVPVLTTPGNDFLFQLSILDTEVLLIMILLSLLNALLIKMQLFIRKTVKEKKQLHQSAKEGVTLFGIVTSSIAATLACAACYSSVLALLGLGTTAFIIEYRIWIAVIALLLTVIAIAYSAKRINNHCAVCHI